MPGSLGAGDCGGSVRQNLGTKPSLGWAPKNEAAVTMVAMARWMAFATMFTNSLAIVLKSDNLEETDLEETNFAMGEDFAEYIYATGTNNHVYRQPLKGLSTAGHWKHVGKGSVISLIADGELLIGIGTNKKPYKQDFPAITVCSTSNL
eukprot:s1479_g12.t1